MSVSFSVEWQDGAFDDVPMFVERAAQREWPRLARHLNLRLLDGVYPLDVTPDMVEPLSSEFGQLFDALSQQNPTPIDPVDDTWQRRKLAVQAILERMSRTTGWSAMIG